MHVLVSVEITSEGCCQYDNVPMFKINDNVVNWSRGRGINIMVLDKNGHPLQSINNNTVNKASIVFCFILNPDQCKILVPHKIHLGTKGILLKHAVRC